jgi:hypothetical protein
MSAPPVPEQPARRWRILLLLSAAVLLGMSLWFTASSVGPQLRALWGPSAQEVGWLTTVVQLGFVAGTAVGRRAEPGGRADGLNGGGDRGPARGHGLHRRPVRLRTPALLLAARRHRGTAPAHAPGDRRVPRTHVGSMCEVQADALSKLSAFMRLALTSELLRLLARQPARQERSRRSQPISTLVC